MGGVFSVLVAPISTAVEAAAEGVGAALSTVLLCLLSASTDALLWLPEMILQLSILSVWPIEFWDTWTGSILFILLYEPLSILYCYAMDARYPGMPSVGSTIEATVNSVGDHNTTTRTYIRVVTQITIQVLISRKLRLITPPIENDNEEDELDDISSQVLGTFLRQLNACLWLCSAAQLDRFYKHLVSSVELPEGMSAHDPRLDVVRIVYEALGPSVLFAFLKLLCNWAALVTALFENDMLFWEGNMVFLFQYCINRLFSAAIRLQSPRKIGGYVWISDGGLMRAP